MTKAQILLSILNENTGLNYQCMREGDTGSTTFFLDNKEDIKIRDKKRKIAMKFLKKRKIRVKKSKIFADIFYVYL